MKKKISLFVVTLVFCLNTLSAYSQSSNKIGKFKDWEARWMFDNDRKICFIYSTPKKSKPSDVKRGDIALLITHRPGEGIKNEVNVQTGYQYMSESEVTVSIGSNKFILFTQGDAAWLKKPADDEKIIKMMRKGSSMTIAGLSSRGTTTKDKYSLMGFTKALKSIDKECKE